MAYTGTYEILPTYFPPVRDGSGPHGVGAVRQFCLGFLLCRAALWPHGQKLRDREDCSAAI